MTTMAVPRLARHDDRHLAVRSAQGADRHLRSTHSAGGEDRHLSLSTSCAAADENALITASHYDTSATPRTRVARRRDTL